MRPLERFLSRWQNLLGLAIVLGFFFVAFAAPWLSPPDDPEAPSPFKVVGRSTDMIPHPPGGEARLGTVVGQLDIYHTIIWGARSALRFGLITTLLTAALGVLIGGVSGYLGGMANELLMRVTDAFLTFPLIAGVWLFRQILMPPRLWMEMTTWLQQTVIEVPEDPEAYLLLADMDFRDGRWAQAGALYEETMERLETFEGDPRRKSK